MARNTEAVLQLEKKSYLVEAFLKEATPDQLRSMLSSLFSTISTDLILNKKYPSMLDDGDDGRYDDGKEMVREDLFDTFVSWAQRKGAE